MEPTSRVDLILELIDEVLDDPAAQVADGVSADHADLTPPAGAAPADTRLRRRAQPSPL